MACYNAALHSKIDRLRFKFKREDNRKAGEALDRLIWFSFPIVYPDYYQEVKDVVKEYDKIFKRRARVRSYLRKMYYAWDRLYLASFTFGDSYDRLSRDTRTRYVREWLNKNCKDYYCCLDIGRENGREHYHAIVACDIDFVEVPSARRGLVFYDLPAANSWSYGFSSFRLIKKDVRDAMRSLNYMLKASDYSFKSACDSSEDRIKPFHKRGVEHWFQLDSDLCLPF